MNEMPWLILERPPEANGFDLLGPKGLPLWIAHGRAEGLDKGEHGTVSMPVWAASELLAYAMRVTTEPPLTPIDTDAFSVLLLDRLHRARLDPHIARNIAALVTTRERNIVRRLTAAHP